MNKQQVMDAISTKKLGVIRKIHYTKNMPNGVFKDTISYVRFITDYENVAVIIEKRNNGIEKANRVYTDTFVNAFISVNKEGREKVRVYTIPNNENLKAHTTYTLNGVETTKQYLIDNGYTYDEIEDYIYY